MILIFGASKGVGKALADTFVNKTTILISRQKPTLKKNQKFLSIDINKINFEEMNNKIKFENIEAVYFPVGLVLENDNLNLDYEEMELLMRTNFLSIIKITEYLIKSKKLSKSCLICFFSSVTTLLPRDKNIIYCASKQSLNSYYKSLKTYISINKLNIRVSLIILGFVNTSMNKNIKTFFPKMEPERLAKYINKKSFKLEGIYYIPFYWFFIKIIINLIPEKIKLFISQSINR